MNTITVTTPLLAETGFDEDGKFILASADSLKTLDGYEYNGDDDTIAEYIEYDGPELKQLFPVIKLVFNEETGLLDAISRFEVDRKLTEEEIAAFMEEFNGQMSDGYGSGMTQFMDTEDGADFQVYWLYNNPDIVEDNYQQPTFTQTA